MWIEFTRVYEWTPPESRRHTLTYQPGRAYKVRRACAEQAIADGAAHEVDAEPDRADDKADTEPEPDGHDADDQGNSAP